MKITNKIFNESSKILNRLFGELDNRSIEVLMDEGD
jgi:hypothetical protein